MLTTISGTILDDAERPYVGFIRFQRYWSSYPPNVVGSFRSIDIPVQADGGFAQPLRPGDYTLAIGDEAPYRIRVPESDGGAFDVTAVVITNGTIAGGAVTLYFGEDAAETMTADEIKANLAAVTTVGIVGVRAFSGGGYKYLAWPASLGAPRAAVGLRDVNTGLPVVMAGTPEGYTESENGYGYKLTTIDTVAYRVYRTLYPLSGSFSILVLK